LQQRYDNFTVSSTETNRRLLDSIRTKDVRIQELVQQLLATEAADSVISSNDNKNADDNSTDAGADEKAQDEFQAEKDDLQQRVDDLEVKGTLPSDRSFSAFDNGVVEGPTTLSPTAASSCSATWPIF
jgi:chromatin remodeling complex protein RSC6